MERCVIVFGSGMDARRWIWDALLDGWLPAAGEHFAIDADGELLGCVPHGARYLELVR